MNQNKPNVKFLMCREAHDEIQWLLATLKGVEVCRSWEGWYCAEPRNLKIHRQAQAPKMKPRESPRARARRTVGRPLRGSAQDSQHPTT